MTETLSPLSPTPTEETTVALIRAYDFFNRALFDSGLKPCMLLLQREKHTRGYFIDNRFIRQHDRRRADEIALNPSYFASSPIEDVLSTLVHEMVHMWQQQTGKPGRGRYHNKEWAAMMEKVGLCPSATGLPGGAKTGDRMSHYIVTGGRFIQTCRSLLDQGFTIPWLDRYPIFPRAGGSVSAAGEADDEIRFQPMTAEDLSSPPIAAGEMEDIMVLEPRKQTRSKYTCPGCGINLWGGRKLYVKCGLCNKGLYETVA